MNLRQDKLQGAHSSNNSLILLHLSVAAAADDPTVGWSIIRNKHIGQLFGMS